MITQRNYSENPTYYIIPFIGKFHNRKVSKDRIDEYLLRGMGRQALIAKECRSHWEVMKKFWNCGDGCMYLWLHKNHWIDLRAQFKWNYILLKLLKSMFFITSQFWTDISSLTIEIHNTSSANKKQGLCGRKCHYSLTLVIYVSLSRNKRKVLVGNILESVWFCSSMPHLGGYNSPSLSKVNRGCH